MLVIEMSELQHNIELSPVSSESNTSKSLFSSSDNDMSYKVFSLGLMAFVGAEVYFPVLCIEGISNLSWHYLDSV